MTRVRVTSFDGHSDRRQALSRVVRPGPSVVPDRRRPSRLPALAAVTGGVRLPGCASTTGWRIGEGR